MRPRQTGFTYLAVLFAVAFIGIGLAAAGAVWKTAVVHGKEVQLLYAGNQYRRAIGRYYAAGLQQYPRALEDLLRDPRKPGLERYLRKIYPDPVTGGRDWGIVKAPDGGIMGVYSLSGQAPQKKAGFARVDKSFEGTSSYSDWKFVYDPSSAPIAPPQAAMPAASGLPNRQ